MTYAPFLIFKFKNENSFLSTFALSLLCVLQKKD